MSRSLFIALFILVGCTAYAQGSEGARYRHFLEPGGVAISGYDPVAYFTEGRAHKGQPSLSYKYIGITYFFSSAQNLETFKQNPTRYEPQYGGWCAYAMGKTGEKVEVDPATFKISNGKLYLFYHTYFNNTLNSWNEDEANLMRNADAHWGQLFK